MPKRMQTIDPREAYGRRIKSAKMVNGELIRIRFKDGGMIEIRDDRQLCCERRYMTCDDDLRSLVGQTLTRIEEKPGPSEEAGSNVHDQVFLEIGTDQGFVTIANHNEHSGYYGGFALNVKMTAE